MPDVTTDTNKISIPGRFTSDGKRLIRAEKIGDATRLFIDQSRIASLNGSQRLLYLFICT